VGALLYSASNRTLRVIYAILAATGLVAIARSILGFAQGPNGYATVGSALPNLLVLLVVGTLALVVSLLSLLSGSKSQHDPP
jgi:hypothetical protein